MKTYLDCIPCFFKQVLETSKITSAIESLQKQIIDEVARIIPDLNLDVSPPELASKIHEIIRRKTQNFDPYKKLKDKSNRIAMELYPSLKQKVKSDKNPLLKALELAIAGNIIDFGIHHELDIEKEIQKIIETEESMIRNRTDFFHYEAFLKALQNSPQILYLGDNAGETVFDLILIEQIKEADPQKKIIFTVKENPIINDALVEDAYFCGIDNLAEVISSGSNAPGTVLNLCKPAFLELFQTAPMVISKGQGNFEALSGKTEREVFFLFKAKCPVVANHVGCPLGQILLLHSTILNF